MPDYKLKNGKIVTVKEEDVQSFMSSKHGDGAVLIEAKETKPVKTEAVATETAPVTAVNEAVDTDLASEDISLEQFEAMEPAEKRKLSYRDSQRLIKERDELASFKNKSWGEQFASQVDSPNFEDLSTNQISKIKEKATKDLLSQKTDKDTGRGGQWSGRPGHHCACSAGAPPLPCGIWRNACNV